MLIAGDAELLKWILNHDHKVFFKGFEATLLIDADSLDITAEIQINFKNQKSKWDKKKSGEY